MRMVLQGQPRSMLLELPRFDGDQLLYPQSEHRMNDVPLEYTFSPSGVVVNSTTSFKHEVFAGDPLRARALYSEQNPDGWESTYACARRSGWSLGWEAVVPTDSTLLAAFIFIEGGQEAVELVRTGVAFWNWGSPQPGDFLGTFIDQGGEGCVQGAMNASFTARVTARSQGEPEIKLMGVTEFPTELSEIVAVFTGLRNQIRDHQGISAIPARITSQARVFAGYSQQLTELTTSGERLRQVAKEAAEAAAEPSAVGESS
jgi:hypothetical protein